LHKDNVIDPSELTPITIHEFKLFAPTQVNRVKTLAYLDTGANHANVSAALAEGLPRAGNAVVGSAFEQKTFESVADIEVDFLGNVQHIGSHINQGPDESLPFSSQITLGAPTIFAKPLVLDFRMLGILPPKQTSPNSWTSLPVQFLEGAGLCVIQLSSLHGAIQVLFDTGAGVSVINTAHSQEIGLDMRPAFSLQVSDATGTKTTQKFATCSGLNIGSSPLPRFDCFSIDLQMIEKALGCRVDMIFGANAMLKSGYRWLFDMPAGKAYVEA